jgi:hypothetical protein
MQTETSVANPRPIRSPAQSLRALEPVLPFAGMAGFLAVIIGVFSPFAQFPVEGFPTWFGGGAGSGMPVLIFAVIGGLAFAVRVYSVPLVIACMSGFVLAMDVLTSYDSSAILKNTVNIPTAEFRFVLDIFLDAFRFGHGAFYILFGLGLVFLVCFLAFAGRIMAEEDSGTIPTA